MVDYCKFSETGDGYYVMVYKTLESTLFNNWPCYVCDVIYFDEFEKCAAIQYNYNYQCVPETEIEYEFSKEGWNSLLALVVGTSFQNINDFLEFADTLTGE